jgi:hypothetical protein
METAVAALIIIALITFGVLTLSESALSAQDTLQQSWQEMQARLEDQSRTHLTPIEDETQVVGNSLIQITLRNDGDTKLTDLEQWDVILQYTGDGNPIVEWYPFGSGINQWTEFINTDDDVFDPGILNPGERIMIQIWVSPSVTLSTTNRANISMPNGVNVSTVFTN